jgi:hypothetical protein
MFGFDDEKLPSAYEPILSDKILPWKLIVEMSLGPLIANKFAASLKGSKRKKHE